MRGRIAGKLAEASGPHLSVVIGTAEVIATMGANQLAFVAGKAVRTGGTDLAVVIDRGFVGSLDARRASRTAL